MDEKYIKDATFEHEFWLRVMEEHALFIHDALASKENKDQEKTFYFMNGFYTLRSDLQELNPSNAISFAKKAEELTKEMRDYKLSILERQLKGNVVIHLTPTFINHMVNELEEYILILDYLKQGETPPIFHELHHHLLWLRDASGHASSINDKLDGVEKRLKEKSFSFAHHFEQFYMKAIELTDYLRTNETSFPALKRFNHDVEIELNLFKVFLHELEEMELSAEVLSSFTASMADHMAREEHYYLSKVAASKQMTNN